MAKSENKKDGHNTFGKKEGIHEVPSKFLPLDKIKFQSPFKESSQVMGYFHDTEEQVLYLQFNKGGVYAYEGISAPTYKKLISVDMSEESLGVWVSANITQNKKVPYTKLK